MENITTDDTEKKALNEGEMAFEKGEILLLPLLW
jgi:hypothetical protein